MDRQTPHQALVDTLRAADPTARVTPVTATSLMRWQVCVVMSALGVGAPLAAQSVPAVPPSVVIPIIAGEVGRTSTAPTAGVPSEQGGEKGKKKEDEGVRVVFRDRPSIRAGEWLRIDLRLKLQSDYRRSEQDLTDSGGSYGLYRRRAGVKGELFKRFEFEVERELKGTSDEAARSTNPWHDVYVNFKATPAIQVQAGRFKIPFSLDELGGIFDLEFAFRSLVARQLSPGRDVGVMVHGTLFEKRLRYQAGVFRADGDNAPIPEPALPGETTPRNRSYAGRVVWEAAKDVSIGGGVVSASVPEGRNSLRDRSVFRYHTYEPLFVQGRRLRVGADVNWTPGPFSVRGEYLRSQEARVGQGFGIGKEIEFSLPDYIGRGWYVAGTWALTGEKKAGGIEPKKPFLQGGFGAIEVIGRIETLTFTSADTSEPPSRSPRAANPDGNTERVVTFGADWYLNQWIKVQVNNIGEQIEDPRFSPVPGKHRFWSTVLRLQFVM